MLIILGGLPGSGKTTLARELAKHLKAVYLRIDSIEQAIKESMLKVGEVLDAGYVVGQTLAKDNLSIGQIVIADSVNSIEITRKAWVNVAKNSKSDFVEIEIICSNKSEHKNRVETRQADIKGHVLPDWKKVETRDYEAWESKHITIDTSGKTVEDSVNELLDKLKPFLRKISTGLPSRRAKRGG